MKHLFFPLLCFVLLSVSCRRDAARGHDAGEVDPVEIGRIDLAAINADTAAFDALKPGSALWLSVIGADTADVAGYFARVADKPYNDPLIVRWGRVDSLSLALARIFNNVESLAGAAVPTRVYAVVSPYNQSVVTADSVLFIALNHYLGADNEIYAYFPDYIRRLKSADRIGIDVAQALVVGSHPFAPSSAYPTALARMAYEGAVVEAVMQATGRSEQEVLGYDDEQYRWLNDNEAQAWLSMLSRDMVFSTDPAVVEGLVRQGAVTTVLHHESPGSAGRFIGHRLVASWLRNHPDATLETLLSPSFYESSSLLETAGYDVK